MNKTLSALMTKLKNQLTEILQQLQLLEEEYIQLEVQLKALQQRISNASKTSRIIIPEREIAGMHFIMSQQQIEDELKVKHSELNSQQKTLQEKKIRLETELKMLEIYQSNQQKIEVQQRTLAEQNFMDEWVVQRRVRK